VVFLNLTAIAAEFAESIQWPRDRFHLQWHGYWRMHCHEARRRLSTSDLETFPRRFPRLALPETDRAATLAMDQDDKRIFQHIQHMQGKELLVISSTLFCAANQEFHPNFRARQLKDQ
jgi:uncharacterized membrane protein (UPF0182 family)